MDLADARHQLLSLARRKHCRIVAWSRQQPTDWRPGQVINPETGMVFTETSAWDLIVRLLENRHPLETILLHKPPGKTAYVMLVDLENGEPSLYIKLQLGSGKIICRSFHYSVLEAGDTR